MLSRSDLHEYQNRFVEFIQNTKRCGGFLGMGLGKSVSSLTAVSDLIDGFTVKRVLVVAPLRVANSVWKQEAEKWAHLNHLKLPFARVRNALASRLFILMLMCM